MKDKRKNDPNLNDDASGTSTSKAHKIPKTGKESSSSVLSNAKETPAGFSASLVTTSVPPVAPSIRGASRKNRVYVFREFIHQTYGSYLKEGSVVLDTAGGKGDLSWLLRNMDGLDSVVVDPRVTKSQHILRSIQYLREHPEQAKERAIPNRLTYQPLAALLPLLGGREKFDSPRHLRLLVDEDLVAAIRYYKKNQEDMDRWEEYWKRATKKAVDAQPLGYKEETAMDDETSTIENALEGLRTILSTKLVLGFHPDQATDPALDLALLLGVPYCIVPCCVFPREFPHRKLVDGSRVRNYSELVHYLQEKYKPKKDKLPFHFTETSKNLVLYSLPGDFLTSSPGK
jgi:hypothetical protein